MRVIFDCLIEYLAFLEKTSYAIIENKNSYDRTKILNEIDKCCKDIKKNNKRLLRDKINDIFYKGCFKNFDVIFNSISEINKISLVHVLLEICLRKTISMKKIFKKKNRHHKIWNTINEFLDDMYFFFEYKEFYNEKPETILRIV